MDFDTSRHYMLNRVLLSTIGIWPYRSVWYNQIQRIFYSCCFVMCIIFQSCTFITHEYKLDLLLEILSCMIPCFIALVKYNVFCLKIKTMKEIMEMMKYDWSTLKNKMEYEIIKKYTYVGVFHAQLFACKIGKTLLCYITIVAYSTPILFGCVHFIPNFLDLVAPLNQSRPLCLLIVVELFVDIEEYFYPILLLTAINFFFVQIVLLSTMSIYVAFIQHACGLFEVASYRIEHVLDDYKKGISFSGRHCIACTGIMNAIDMHRRAIEFFEFAVDPFMLMYFFLLMLGITSLTVNLFRALSAMTLIESTAVAINIFIHVFYFFLISYTGQRILDHSSDFLSRVYNSKWHMIPLHAQKLVLFVMQRSSKNCMVVLYGGVFVATFEGFATAMSASLSYLMVLYSVQ